MNGLRAASASELTGSAIPPTAPWFASPRGLVIEGRLYYYAMLMYEKGDDELYRKPGVSPVYGAFSQLAADLERDGVKVVAEADGIVDVDSALLVVSRSMSEDQLSEVIVAWNCLEELLTGLSLPFNFHGRLSDSAYSRLFWGMNLPSLTPPGEHWVPHWTPRLLAKIHQILSVGASRVLGHAASAGVVGSPSGADWSS